MLASSTLMPTPDHLSHALQEVRPGVWSPAVGVAEVSYPDANHQTQAEFQVQSFWYQHRLRCLQQVFDQFPTPQLLDVGGSNGQLDRALPGVQVMLLEPGSTGVAYAEAQGLQPIIHADFHSANFHDQCLPAVGLFDVLEHIPDDEAFLQEVFRTLKPGGRLYLTVPAYQALWSPFDEAVGHHRRYTLRTLGDKLRGAGFEVEYASYLFSWLPIPVWLLRKLRALRGQAKADQQDHAPASQGRGKWLMRLLGFEPRWIARKWRIPLGTSCLSVARKPQP